MKLHIALLVTGFLSVETLAFNNWPLEHQLKHIVTYSGPTESSKKRISWKTGPKAKQSIAKYIDVKRFTQAELPIGSQFSVRVLLYVSEQGLVTNCDFVKNSGSVAFGTRLCERLKQRARYTPALDAAGKATASIDGLGSITRFTDGHSFVVPDGIQITVANR